MQPILQNLLFLGMHVESPHLFFSKQLNKLLRVFELEVPCHFIDVFLNTLVSYWKFAIVLEWVVFWILHEIIVIVKILDCDCFYSPVIHVIE